MPLGPSQPQIRSPDNIGRNGMFLFIIGGIALVLAALWWLFPEALQKKDPLVGRLEARYREEGGSLLRAAGVAPDASHCSYSAKLLVLACRVAPSANTSLPSALQQAGWVVATGKRGQLVFTRGRDTASLSCERPTPPELCEFTLRYRLNNADA